MNHHVHTSHDIFIDKSMISSSIADSAHEICT